MELVQGLEEGRVPAVVEFVRQKAMDWAIHRLVPNILHFEREFVGPAVGTRRRQHPFDMMAALQSVVLLRQFVVHRIDQLRKIQWEEEQRVEEPMEGELPHLVCMTIGQIGKMNRRKFEQPNRHLHIGLLHKAESIGK
jgi:hypothetical protein